MREQVIALLGQILQNNVGNRLTEELATGIATTVNHHLLQSEAVNRQDAAAPPELDAGERRQPNEAPAYCAQSKAN